MGLTFREYIGKYYNVTDRIKARLINPKEAVAERDDLPYDDIIYIDDELQKVVYITDDSPISVVELLSYTAEDMHKINDPDLINVYDNYMEQVNVEDVDLANLISAAQIFMREKKEGRMRLAGCIQ